jgi:hypothetical protein
VVFVVFCVDEESVVVAYVFSTAPVLASLSWVQVPIADDLRKVEWMDVLAATGLMVAAVLTVGAAGIVGIVFGLSVGVAFDIAAGCPMQRYMVFRSELSHS